MDREHTRAKIRQIEGELDQLRRDVVDDIVNAREGEATIYLTELAAALDHSNIHSTKQLLAKEKISDRMRDTEHGPVLAFKDVQKAPWA